MQRSFVTSNFDLPASVYVNEQLTKENYVVFKETSGNSPCQDFAER